MTIYFVLVNLEQSYIYSQKCFQTDYMWSDFQKFKFYRKRAKFSIFLDYKIDIKSGYQNIAKLIIMSGDTRTNIECYFCSKYVPNICIYKTFVAGSCIFRQKVLVGLD